MWRPKWAVKHLLLGLVTCLVSIVLVYLSAGSALADGYVQSFNAKESLDPGWVVALSSKDTSTVQAASIANNAGIYGVVVDPSRAPLTVQRKGQQVFVATSGDYPVLVSTQNGAIKEGDFIALSSVNGIAGKATAHQAAVLGQALTNFDGKKNVITTVSGWAIGQVNVSIKPGRNPILREDVAIPSPLKTVGQSIAGKSVSALRIYSSLVIFVVTAVSAASLLLAGVRNGMLSIGRNPLSRKLIIRSIIQVAIISILIFVAGLFGVYLLLRL